NNLLNDFNDVFAFKSSDMGTAFGIEHFIDTGDSKPIKQRNYRYGRGEHIEMNLQIKEMLKNGVITKSASPWNNPIVPVWQNNKMRFCLDYRKLNDVTKEDVFPLPLIQDLLDLLEGKPVFSSFDLKSGYWQIALRDEDKEKTAFTAA